MNEIERKFLVKGDFMPYVVSSTHIAQGYLSSVAERTVRVRLRGDKGYLTIKGRSSDDGLSRYEWEKEIPAGEACELLKLCEGGVIDKTRHIIPYGRHTWEVDVFHGENEGLVMAEIELSDTCEEFEKPEWIADEVTGDKRYYNSYISSHPYSRW
ncbi:MAG: CYTH domain-containing protein [Flavobacteriales bacterium]|nr:CYTH domain-containing protein [Flavobacteriales bacterium]